MDARPGAPTDGFTAFSKPVFDVDARPQDATASKEKALFERGGAPHEEGAPKRAFK
jgi:hypothetical protein